MWFDSHCHLYDCEDPAVAAARAREVGVTDVLIPGVEATSGRKALELAGELGWWAAVGVHPSEMRGWEDARLEEIEPLLEHERAVAVGETGLDFHWDKTFNDDQLRGFAAHVALSKRSDRALVIHTRDSVDAALDLLEQVGPPQVLIFHCWSGDASQLARALRLGAFISFAGNVSFQNAGDLRAVAGRVPADRLLVETDAPYLAPVPVRGRPNEPAFVVHVGEALAAARGADVGEVAEATSANARAVFGLQP